ncbi:hypothetical protein K0B96_06510 [Horticoccus luteus]|uniref:Uncharacterized protein n=1 Tax=Horticoccus luteus TaxID=2862869 RepID=A0A8F9XMI0_9BACT|nr:hypothetical protein [Horticoccus luteus]QYM80261.1 hypothetical protein K0B96_06510 [Horticoccus luteus]
MKPTQSPLDLAAARIVYGNIDDLKNSLAAGATDLAVLRRARELAGNLREGTTKCRLLDAAIRQATPPDPLFHCPYCTRGNFTRQGLRAHRCEVRGGKPLSIPAVHLAIKRGTAATAPQPSALNSQPNMSSSPKKHALTLLAAPDLAVAKDGVAKLQSLAVAQVAAVGEMESNAAKGGILAGLTLHRVKASLPHGHFGKWIGQISTAVEICRTVKKSQANNYMRLAMVFLEKTKAQKPELLALPGDQTSLDLADNHAGQQLRAKLEKFTAGLSLNELLIKHGIKGVGLKTELETAKEDEDDAPQPGQAEDYFTEVAERVYGFRQLVTSRENIARLTPQQLETLHQTVTDSVAEFRRLYDEAKGKTSALPV